MSYQYFFYKILILRSQAKDFVTPSSLKSTDSTCYHERKCVYDIVKGMPVPLAVSRLIIDEGRRIMAVQTREDLRG